MLAAETENRVKAEGDTAVNPGEKMLNKQLSKFKRKDMGVSSAGNEEAL
jgi:hypothetical protein